MQDSYHRAKEILGTHAGVGVMTSSTGSRTGHSHSNAAADRDTLPDLGLLLSGIMILAVWTGGIRPNALFLACTLLAGACVFVTYRREVAARSFRQRLLLGSVVVAVAWMTLNAVPLPGWLLAVVRGPRAELYAVVRTAYSLALDAGWTGLPGPRLGLDLNRAGALRLLVLGIGMVCAARLAAGLSHRNRKRLLSMLVALGVLVAAGGILAHVIIAPRNAMWWLFEIEAEQSLACFVNPNHFGAFLAMLCPAAIALGAADIQNREWERLLLWVAALAIMITGVVLSQSRGAYICLVGALLATGLLFARRDNLLGGIGLAALVWIAFLLIAVLGTGEMDQELRTLRGGDDAHRRWQIWRGQGLAIWKRYPLIGAGPEGYRTVSSRYEQKPDRVYSHHAESTYVQLLADGGIVGVTVTGIVLAAYLLNLLHSRKSRAVGSTVRISALGALSVACVHGIFDFGMHVPIYAVVVASCAGLLLNTQPRQRHHHRSRARWWKRPRLHRALWPALATVLVVTVWGRAGNAVYTRDKDWAMAEAGFEGLIANLGWTPAYWVTWYQLGRRALESADLEKCRFGEYCLTQAAALNPRHPEIWKVLAEVRLRLGRINDAVTAWRRHVELLPVDERNRLEILGLHGRQRL